MFRKIIFFFKIDIPRLFPPWICHPFGILTLFYSITCYSPDTPSGLGCIHITRTGIGFGDGIVSDRIPHNHRQWNSSAPGGEIIKKCARRDEGMASILL